MRMGKLTLWMLAALLLFGLLPAVGAQDAAGELTEGLSNTQISLVNPFTGQGVSVTLFRALYVVAGVLLLILGWRSYKIALGVIGFVVGSSIGAGIAAQIGADTTLTLLISLIIGIVGVLLAVFAYYVAIAVFGAYIGYLIAGNIMLWLNYTPAEGSVYLLILLFGAILGGAVAVALSLELIVILTSYLGAVMLVAGLGLAATPNGLWWVIGLFMLGVLVQIGMARAMDENAFRRRRYA